MKKHFARLTAGVSIVFLLVGNSPAQPVGIPDPDLPRQLTNKMCTWLNTTYTIGAIVKDSKYTYRCMEVFANEKPSSVLVAWVPFKSTVASSK